MKRKVQGQMLGDDSRKDKFGSNKNSISSLQNQALPTLVHQCHARLPKDPLQKKFYRIPILRFLVPRRHSTEGPEFTVLGQSS